MPTVTLPQTFKPPFSRKRSIGVVNKLIVPDNHLRLSHEDVDLENGKIELSLNSLIKHGGSDFFEPYAELDMELRSVFDFYILPPDTKEIYISIKGFCDNHYKVKLRPNLGISKASFEIGSDLIVTFSPDLEDLDENLTYRRNLWRYKREFGRFIHDKNFAGNIDVSLPSIFATDLIVPDNRVHSVGIGIALFDRCYANDTEVECDFEDRWQFEEIQVWQH